MLITGGCTQPGCEGFGRSQSYEIIDPVASASVVANDLLLIAGGYDAAITPTAATRPVHVWPGVANSGAMMSLRALRAAPAVAGAAVVVAAVAGDAIGRHDWGRPRQLLHAPYVADVPVAMLSVFIALASGGLLIAAALRRRLVPSRARGRRAWLLAAIAVSGAAAATWGGLYAGAVENAIPILDWAFFAVPIGLAALVEGHSDTVERPLVTGLLVAVPIAAVNAFGWSIYASPGSGLPLTLVSGGIGVLLGLAPALFASQPTAAPPGG